MRKRECRKRKKLYSKRKRLNSKSLKGEIACKEKDSVAAVKIDLIAARNNLERETQSSKKR